MATNASGLTPVDLQLAEVAFFDTFNNVGYHPIDPVPVSGNFDRTTRFIGSTVSVLKPFFVPGFPGYVGNTAMLPNPFLSQKCVRTQNLNRLGDPEAIHWGSFFVSLGALALCQSSFDGMINGAVSFVRAVNNKLNSGPELPPVQITASSQDEDLIKMVIEAGVEDQIVFDSLPAPRYRHSVGHDDQVRGRNVNIQVFNPSKNGFFDIGNLILLENIQGQHRPVLELALGLTTMVSHIKGLEHPLDTLGACDALPTDVRSKKVLDCVVTSLVLLDEGLRPGGSNNKRRLLREYMLGAYKLSAALGEVNIKDVVNFVVTKVPVSEQAKQVFLNWSV